MTGQTAPLTDQQLDDLEALATSIPAGPWTVDDSRAELRGSHGNLLADLWDDRLGAYFAAMSPKVAKALVAEVRRLRTEVAALTEARRLEWVTAHGQTPHTPRLCECGHSHLAHTVPAPHSCFAHGQTCPCEAYRQLPHDEAVTQLKRNQQAAAAAPDPICGDENDGDWCELEPGHEGHHRADTAEWADAPAARPAAG